LRKSKYRLSKSFERLRLIANHIAACGNLVAQVQKLQHLDGLLSPGTTPSSPLQRLALQQLFLSRSHRQPAMIWIRSFSSRNVIVRFLRNVTLLPWIRYGRVSAESPLVKLVRLC